MPAPRTPAPRSRRGRAPSVAVLLAALGSVLAFAAAAALSARPADAAPAAGHAARAPVCLPRRASPAYAARVGKALRARRDVWGEELLAAPGGPTYERARRYLGPLLLARARGRRPLTASGFHYVPFSLPLGPAGAGSVFLHVADGSQILAERAGGRALTVAVGGERYGSCVARLTTGRLAGGWLPILRTRYVDAAGNRYEQESFAGRLPGRSPLTALVRVAVEARRPVRVVVRASGGRARAVTVAAGARQTLHLAWEGGRALRPVEPETYAAARRATVAHWMGALREGASVDVPERVVMDAQRALLVQNLALAWRYSIGNPYEQFSFPESVDAAQVMAEWGRGDVSRSILRVALTRKPTPYPNWKMGEKLLGSAVHYRLFRDAGYVAQATPELGGYVADMADQIAIGPRRLLARERYSSDITDSVYGLHSQAVAWQGAAAMAGVWAEAGFRAEAARARAVADRLGRGLRLAVGASQRRLADGSLFVPVDLLGRERPYGSLTEARLGSYWNLVMPYALASGLFRPGGPQARGVFDYMQRHGSRLLGVVRAGAYGLYGRRAGFPVGGTDEVYGINMARFLADNDEADQLVLSLYGQLAVAMTPGTFVGGEAASVAPLGRAFHRATYLPPNVASNGAFLTKLRLMLVHETRRADGAPHGLRLGFSTPRAWLGPGKRITVRRVPTSFGPVSYEVVAASGAVTATVDVPARAAPRTLALRLRLPPGTRIAAVRVGDRPHRRFDAATGTIDLSGRRGRVVVVAQTTRRSLTRADAPLATPSVRRLTVPYVSHGGVRRRLTVVLPASYAPAKDPPLPLVVSPHGRGLDGRQNAALWGTLPARGPFVVVSPDGHGRRLDRYSWGYAGQIDDLARMPGLVARALPWLRIDPRRIYAIGGSMGGQETLLLLARYPRLLAGAAAFDAVADFRVQYRRFPRLRCTGACARARAVPLGVGLQQLAREEVGGAPDEAPAAWAARSPIAHARRIARSCVPLQLWWSVADRVVTAPQLQSGALFWQLRRLNPHAPVSAYVGSWRHSAEMKENSRLPLALVAFGLLDEDVGQPAALRVVPAPRTSSRCAARRGAGHRP